MDIENQNTDIHSIDVLKSFYVSGAIENQEDVANNISDIYVDISLLVGNIEEIFEDEYHLEGLQKTMTGEVVIDFSNQLISFLRHYVSYLKTLLTEDVDKKLKDNIAYIAQQVCDTDVEVNVDYDNEEVYIAMNLVLHLDPILVDNIPTENEYYNEEKDYDN